MAKSKRKVKKKEVVEEIINYPMLDEKNSICRDVYKLYPHIDMTIDDFIIKFSFFLISRNIREDEIVLKHISKFMKLQYNYNIESIKKEFEEKKQ